MQTTLKAIQKIQEIKEQRENAFYQNRMKVKRKNELQEAMRDLKQNINLIEAPTSLHSKKPIEIKVGAQTQKRVHMAGAKKPIQPSHADDMEY